MTTYTYEAFKKRYGRENQENVHEIFQNVQRLFRNAQMFLHNQDEIEILLNDQD